MLVACQIGLGITSADYRIYSIVPAQQGGLWYYCSITSLYHVRHVWYNMHSDLKHQTDNDVARIRTIKETESVDGRTNNSRNAEMMIKAIRPRRTVPFF